MTHTTLVAITFLCWGIIIGIFLFWAYLKWGELGAASAELDAQNQRDQEVIDLHQKVGLQTLKPPKGSHAVEVKSDVWIYPN